MNTSTNNIEKKLASIESQLQKRIKEGEKAEIERNLLLKNIEKEFNCKTIDELEELLEDLIEERDSLKEVHTEKLNSLIKDLEREGLLE